MTAFEEYITGLGFKLKAKCSCMAKTQRWKRPDGHEIKVNRWGEWQLINNGIKRYGKAETAIQEVQDYFDKLMA